MSKNARNSNNIIRIVVTVVVVIGAIVYAVQTGGFVL